MTPNQRKVHNCLSADEPMTRMELSRKTGLNYNAVHKAMVYLMETGHATSSCIDKVAHYTLAAEAAPHHFVVRSVHESSAVGSRPARWNTNWPCDPFVCIGANVSMPV